MKLLDEKEHKKTLKELMEMPFGGYQQKPMIKQPEPGSKLINDPPVENQNAPVSATTQPPSPLSLHKAGTAELSLTRLGAVIAVSGTIFGYLYATSSAIQLETNTLLSKLSTFANNPIIMGSIVVGVILCSLGLVFRK